MLLPTLIGGITLGFLYGLIALTLILLVRTTGVLNFAAADLGMFCAFIAFVGIVQWQLPTGVALVLTAFATIALGAIIYVAIILVRPADPLMLSLRTLGLFIIIKALSYKLWGANSPYTFPHIVPNGSVSVFGFNVSYVQAMVIVLTIIVAVVVSVITEKTRIGLMLRAVSADRDAASDLGAPVVRVDLVAWCLATLIAGIVGVLVAQLFFLAPDMMQPVLLAGFAAAQLGDMQNIRVALLGGLALGLIQSASSVYLNQPEWSQILAFAALALGLLIRGRIRRRVIVT